MYDAALQHWPRRLKIFTLKFCNKCSNVSCDIRLFRVSYLSTSRGPTVTKFSTKQASFHNLQYKYEYRKKSVKCKFISIA